MTQANTSINDLTNNNNGGDYISSSGLKNDNNKHRTKKYIFSTTNWFSLSQSYVYRFLPEMSFYINVCQLRWRICLLSELLMKVCSIWTELKAKQAPEQFWTTLYRPVAIISKIILLMFSYIDTCSDPL